MSSLLRIRHASALKSSWFPHFRLPCSHPVVSSSLLVSDKVASNLLLTLHLLLVWYFMRCASMHKMFWTDRQLQCLFHYLFSQIYQSGTHLPLAFTIHSSICAPEMNSTFSAQGSFSPSCVAILISICLSDSLSFFFRLLLLGFLKLKSPEVSRTKSFTSCSSNTSLPPTLQKYRIFRGKVSPQSCRYRFSERVLLSGLEIDSIGSSETRIWPLTFDWNSRLSTVEKRIKLRWTCGQAGIALTTLVRKCILWRPSEENLGRAILLASKQHVASRHLKLY